MLMQTQILRNSESILNSILTDRVVILSGFKSVMSADGYAQELKYTAKSDVTPALIQSTTLPTLSEGVSEQQFSVKLPFGTDVKVGDAVQLVSSDTTPSSMLNDMSLVFVIESVNHGSFKLITKCTARQYEWHSIEGVD